ncbi:MAG: aldehyde dehydrogenase family protein [Acidimicrobiales bacterium]
MTTTAATEQTSPSTITVRAPFDGGTITEVAATDSAGVNAAIARGRSMLRAVHAGEFPAWKRSEVLDLAARTLRERIEEFARTIALESAKPIRTARVEAQRAVSTLTFSAVEARTLAGHMVPMEGSEAGAGKLAFTLRSPIGVIGAISPFNFPLNLVAHKVGPAIAAGAPVVLKPASSTPLSALALAALLNECGLPDGFLTVTVGAGSTVGDALVNHDDIAMITFTGSPDVGWGIRARAPRKKVGLELGNNAPVIIEPDGDWQRAARLIKTAGFSHAGQSCISTQRIFVHESIAAQFTELLEAEVQSLVVGDPLDEQTEVSALISLSERDRVCEWVNEAVLAGATLVTGGQIDGSLLRPTILSNVADDMKVSYLEVFGPVVGISTYRDFDTAIERANDTRYGLQASVFTSRLDRAMQAVHGLDFGGVLVNEVPTYRADQMPYGGLRDSGNTHEGPAYAVREMTHERLAVIQL